MCGGGGGDNTPKQTEGEKQLAGIAAEKWNMYQEKLKPFENLWMQKSEMRPQDYAKAKGQANVDAQAAFGQQPVVQAGEGRGNLARDIVGHGEAVGATKASNIVRANNLTDDRQAQGLESIIAAGLGQSHTAQATQADVAQQNAQSANASAMRDWQDKQNTMNAIGGVAGMATMYGYNNLTPSSTQTPVFSGGSRAPGMSPEQWQNSGRAGA